MKEAEYLKALNACVRCGSCKASCPTYDECLNEGMAARGRLRLLWELHTGNLKPTPLLMDRLFSCALCGICEKGCPTGVDITGAIYHARALLSSSDRKRFLLRKTAEFALKRTALSFKWARLFEHVIMPYLIKSGIIPFKLKLPENPLRGRLQVFKTGKSKKGRVAVFAGCSVNYIYPSYGKSFINLLLDAGYEVVLPQGEACCGAPLRALGLEEEAAGLFRKNIETFGRLNVDSVVSLCPTCTLEIKERYKGLSGECIEAEDIIKFIAGKINSGKAPIGAVTYHDPCHLRYGLGLREEPREIIKALGYELIEPEEAGCCGFGISMTHKDLSSALLNERALHLRATGADTVVTACPACVLQLGRTDMNIRHISELLKDIPD
jgi:glycolate oxidase iron-sulfur subunit